MKRVRYNYFTNAYINTLKYNHMYIIATNFTPKYQWTQVLPISTIYHWIHLDIYHWIHLDTNTLGIVELYPPIVKIRLQTKLDIAVLFFLIDNYPGIKKLLESQVVLQMKFIMTICATDENFLLTPLGWYRLNPSYDYSKCTELLSKACGWLDSWIQANILRWRTIGIPKP